MLFDSRRHHHSHRNLRSCLRRNACEILAACDQPRIASILAGVLDACSPSSSYAILRCSVTHRNSLRLSSCSLFMKPQYPKSSAGPQLIRVRSEFPFVIRCKDQEQYSLHLLQRDCSRWQMCDSVVQGSASRTHRLLQDTSS